MSDDKDDKVGELCLPIKSAKKNLSSVMQKFADFCGLRKSSDFVVQHRRLIQETYTRSMTSDNSDDDGNVADVPVIILECK